MRTTDLPCSTDNQSLKKSAKEIITVFWHSALFGLKCPENKMGEYNVLIKSLVLQFQQGCLKAMKSRDLFELHQSRTKENQFSSIS